MASAADRSDPGPGKPALAVPRAEQFPHDADIGVRGVGRTREEAFEQAALALMGIVTDVDRVRPECRMEVFCNARDDGFLLVDWLNALIYRMATYRMLFSRFSVAIDGHRLHAIAWGEPVDRDRHTPAVEPKGATYTALEAGPCPDGSWVAQCVVDV